MSQLPASYKLAGSLILNVVGATAGRPYIDLVPRDNLSARHAASITNH